jgi:hypothetical protein
MQRGAEVKLCVTEWAHQTRLKNWIGVKLVEISNIQMGSESRVENYLFSGEKHAMPSVGDRLPEG